MMPRALSRAAARLWRTLKRCWRRVFPAHVCPTCGTANSCDECLAWWSTK